VDDCDYLVDLDFPLHPRDSPLEPRYVTMTDKWEKVSCHPFLDALHSDALTRMFWLPGEAWQAGNEYGEYCLLRNGKKVSGKEAEVAQKVRSGEIRL